VSDTTVLARKWRPKTFAQLAGQEHVVRALSNALTQKRLHHAYLFTGTRGVGKTTIARILAKSLNCETGITPTPCGVCSACREIDSGRFVDLIELDAASNTQVDNMRELLESAVYAPTSGRYKVYIIDEVHMLSRFAFNAMLKTLEEPPEHVKFVLATTDPQKIPVTVLSRCLQFNLKQLPPSLIGQHLRYVMEQERIPFEEGAIALIARAAQGSMRDALSLLDQAIAYSGGLVEEAMVHTMLGAIDHGYLFDLLLALREQDGARLLAITDTMAERSVAFDAALQELATLLHRVALAQTLPQAIAEDDAERVRLLELASSFPAEDIQLLYQIAIHGRDEIDLAPDEYAGFSMTLLRMLAFRPSKDASVYAVPMQAQSKEQRGAPQDAMAAVKTADAVQSGLSASAADGSQNWAVIVSRLKIQGMAQQLAKNCVLESIAGSKLTLCLSAEHKHLLSNKAASDKLKGALSEYFAKPVTIEIVLGTLDAGTPAMKERLDKEAKQQQASESISRDNFVREAQAQLGATVIPESIKPIS
jgi:DNA polymerase-3 subunit gamma/tau